MTDTAIKTPSILQYSKRVILWSCEVEGGYLLAEIAFFNTNLSFKEFVLSDRKGNKFCKVELPSQFHKQARRGRSQNIKLKIVEML